MTIATAQDLQNNSENINSGVGIKVSFGREIRRAYLKRKSYEDLVDLVSNLFSLNRENVGLKYKDEDGDLITLVCV